MRRIYRRRFTKVKLWMTAFMLLGAAAFGLRMRHVPAAPEGLGLVMIQAAIWAPAVLLALGLAWYVWRHWGVACFFDVDPGSGRFRLWLWRPLGWRRLDGDLEAISGWRYAAGRPPAIRAELADPPMALAFPLRRGVRLHRHWQRIAPDAVAAYERDVASAP